MRTVTVRTDSESTWEDIWAEFAKCQEDFVDPPGRSFEPWPYGCLKAPCSEPPRTPLVPASAIKGPPDVCGRLPLCSHPHSPVLLQPPCPLPTLFSASLSAPPPVPSPSPHPPCSPPSPFSLQAPWLCSISPEPFIFLLHPIPKLSIRCLCHIIYIVGKTDTCGNIRNDSISI